MNIQLITYELKITISIFNLLLSFMTIPVLISIIGWLRFDPSRGIDYRLMVQFFDKNNNITEFGQKRNEKQKVFEINAFRELSILPHYVIKPMKR